MDDSGLSSAGAEGAGGGAGSLSLEVDAGGSTAGGSGGVAWLDWMNPFKLCCLPPVEGVAEPAVLEGGLVLPELAGSVPVVLLQFTFEQLEQLQLVQFFCLE